MEITIYQIIPELDKKHMKFRDLTYLENLEYSTPSAQIYEAIYHGKVDASSLEDIYRIFNRVTESDALFLDSIGFTGHSLSVSDIVEIIDSPDKSRFYFCCSIGFQQVAFDKNLAMGKILNHDYADPVFYTRQGSFYLCLWMSSMLLLYCVPILAWNDVNTAKASSIIGCAFKEDTLHRIFGNF